MKAEGRILIDTLQQMKRRGEKICMLAAYDYPTARLIDEAGAEVILVGDSVGNVVLGYPSTLPVTVDDMVRHTQAVVRGCQRALVVADMPFLSYQTSVEEAIRNAGRLLKEAGAQAVKLEGGREYVETVRALVISSIPVMGHIGYTPQSTHRFGSRVVRGRTSEEATALLADAEALQQAGCFSLVLECMPTKLAKAITEKLEIPTIGIGAGPHCDGQVLVLHDLIGLSAGRKLKHVKIYANVREAISEAVRNFREEIRSGAFPAKEHSFETTQYEEAPEEAEGEG